jgi:predicted amidohydrolase
LTETQKVAAIQMEGRVADLPYNIAQAGDLLEKALRGGAGTASIFILTNIMQCCGVIKQHDKSFDR